MNWASPKRQTDQRLRDWFQELISRYPPRSKRGPLFPAEVSHGHGKPPRAGPGERLKSLGPAAAGKRLGCEYRSGFGWQSLILVVIFAAVVLTVLVPASVLDRIRHGPPRISPAWPDVLVVSAKGSDQAAVIQTAQARDYTVRSVSSVESGLESLRQRPDRIGFVVIDGGMAGAKLLISEVKAACPNARLIVLSGAQDEGEISSRLIDAGMN